MRIFILTAGSGGDFAGAKLIQERLSEQGHAVTFQTTQQTDEKTSDQTEKYDRLLVIGQIATNYAATNAQLLPKANKTCLYAHLMNKELVDDITAKLADRDVLFMTTAASKAAFTEDHSVEFGLAIKTVKLEDNILPEVLEIAKQALSRPTVHLGGSYKNSANADVKVVECQLRAEFLIE